MVAGEVAQGSEEELQVGSSGGKELQAGDNSGEDSAVVREAPGQGGGADEGEEERRKRELEEKAVELYLATGSPKRVERELGIPKYKLYRILRRRGIAPVTKRGWGSPQKSQHDTNIQQATDPQGQEWSREQVAGSEFHQPEPEPARSPVYQAFEERELLRRAIREAHGLDLSGDGEVVQQRVERPAGRMAEVAAEREVVAYATPVLRKVILNPKILLFYDYMKSKGYSGDLGDFIVECIELLFRKMGYQVVIERKVEVE